MVLSLMHPHGEAGTVDAACAREFLDYVVNRAFFMAILWMLMAVLPTIEQLMFLAEARVLAQALAQGASPGS